MQGADSCALDVVDRHPEGLSAAEVAVATGLARTSVARVVSRGLAKLRRGLGVELVVAEPDGVRWLTATQAAAVAGVALSTVTRAISSGVLASDRAGHRHVVALEDVERWRSEKRSARDLRVVPGG
jgi:DNA-directed RNA polymerase specialized sigma24 family protein